MAKKGRIARSMRGESVDFDLFDIKRQMANQPKSTEVKAREDFIEQRLRRRRSKLERNRKAQIEATTQAREEKEQVEESVRTKVEETTEEETQKTVKAETKPKTRRIKKKKAE